MTMVGNNNHNNNEINKNKIIRCKTTQQRK